MEHMVNVPHCDCEQCREAEAAARPMEPVVMPAPMRPGPLPRCKHGGRPGWCVECSKEDQEAKVKTAPLADRYWHNKGKHPLEDFLAAAYKMGMRDAKGA